MTNTVNSPPKCPKRNNEGVKKPERCADLQTYFSTPPIRVAPTMMTRQTPWADSVARTVS